MGVSIPNFADLGFGDPRAAGTLPNYPTESPAVAGEAALGKGIAAAGGAAEDVAAYSQMAKNKMDRAMAEADLVGRTIPLTEQLKTETDPEKITALRGQYRAALETAAGAIGDPNARALWSAQNARVVAAGEAHADLRGKEIWLDRYRGGIDEQAANIVRHASASTDPLALSVAQNTLRSLYGAARDVGALPADRAFAQQKLAERQLIGGSVQSLINSGRPDAATALLDQHGGDLDPSVVAGLRAHAESTGERVAGQSLADRVRGGGSLADRIVMAESGGRDVANAWGGSSASGPGQFIQGTWLDQVKRNAPDVAAGKSDAEILALRGNQPLSRQMVDTYAAENKASLAAQGLPTDDGALYLAHFLGPAGAAKVLSAGPTAPLTQLLPKAAIDANPQLRGMTAGGVRQMTANRIGVGLPEGDDNAAPTSGSGFDPNVWATKTGTPIGLDDKGNLVPQDKKGNFVYDAPGFEYSAGKPAPQAARRQLPDLDQQLQAIEADPNASQKQKDIAAAIVTRDYQRQKAATSAATRQEVAAVNQLIKDDEASIATSGTPVAQITPERVASALGPDKADEFSANRATALRFYDQTHDFASLPQSELDDRVNAMRPTPGQLGFARNVKAFDAAQKMAGDLQKLRLTDPAAAVATLPDVAAAAKGADLSKPETFAPLVRARMMAMDSIGVPDENKTPITRAEAKALWDPIGLANRGGDMHEIAATLADTVRHVQAAFGDQAHRALEAVLREGHTDKETASQAATMMQKLARGQPLTRDEARAFDEAQKSDAAARAVAPVAEPTPETGFTDPLSGAPMAPLPAAPTPRPAPDAKAIEMLRQNPALGPQFEAVYGQGSAAKVLSIAPSRPAQQGAP